MKNLRRNPFMRSELAPIRHQLRAALIQRDNEKNPTNAMDTTFTEEERGVILESEWLNEAKRAILPRVYVWPHLTEEHARSTANEQNAYTIFAESAGHPYKVMMPDTDSTGIQPWYYLNDVILAQGVDLLDVI